MGCGPSLFRLPLTICSALAAFLDTEYSIGTIEERGEGASLAPKWWLDWPNCGNFPHEG